MKNSKFSKEAKIYLVIAIIIFLWITFLPQINDLVNRVLIWLKEIL